MTCNDRKSRAICGPLCLVGTRNDMHRQTRTSNVTHGQAWTHINKVGQTMTQTDTHRHAWKTGLTISRIKRAGHPAVRKPAVHIVRGWTKERLRSKRCSGWGLVRCCSQGCQQQHWQQHGPMYAVLAAAGARTAWVTYAGNTAGNTVLENSYWVHC